MIDTSTHHHEYIAIEQYDRGDASTPGRWTDIGYRLAGSDAVVRAQMIARLKQSSAQAEGKTPRFRIVRVNTLRTIIEETP